MATRNAFNKYSTTEEKLAYLNKKRVEFQNDTLSTKDITQSIYSRESLSATSDYIGDVSATEAHFGFTTYTGGTGYQSSIPLASLNSTISPPCRITITNSPLTLTLSGDYVIVSATNPQPNYYYDDAYMLLTFAYEDGGQYYYSIMDDNIQGTPTYPGNGSYTLETIATAYEITGTTLSINQDIYIENGQEVRTYGNLLYTG